MTATSEDKSNGSSQKRFGGFFFKQAQVEKPTRNSVSSSIDQTKLIKSKLQLYVDEIIGTGDVLASNVDALGFWSGKRDTYGEIAKCALNILSVPASSAELNVSFRWLPLYKAVKDVG